MANPSMTQGLGRNQAAAAGHRVHRVTLYPNPAYATAVVKLPTALRCQAVTLGVVDALGRVVRTQVPSAGGAIHTVPLLNVALGVYLLQLQTEAGVVVKKTRGRVSSGPG